MYCPSCGKNNPTGARYCATCGEPQATPSVWASQINTVSLPRRKTGLLVGALLGAMLVAFALVVLNTSGGSTTSASFDARQAVQVDVLAGTSSVSFQVAVVVDPAVTAAATKAVPSDAAAAGPVVEVSADGRLDGPVQLVFPIEADDPPDSSLPVGGVSYFDEVTRTWVPVPAVWDAERRALVVTTDHLSRWVPWTWDWGRIVGDISASIGRLVGKRTTPPTCLGGTPDWVRSVVFVDYPTNPILACAESDPGDPDIAVVRVTNNRPYAMVLIPTDSYAWSYVDIPDSILGIARQAAMAELGSADALLVPALTESAVGVARGDKLEYRIDAEVSGTSLLVDVGLIALDQVGINDWDIVSGLVECAGDGALALSSPEVSIDYIGRIFGVIGACLSDETFLLLLAETGLDSADIAKFTAVGKAFEAYETLQFATDLYVDEMVLYGDDYVTIFARGDTSGSPSLAPSYQELLTAEIPAMCSHDPTRLVNGEDVEVDPFNGSFELLPSLPNGEPSWATIPSSDKGQITAVVANCNAGGVGWPDPIMFFSNGPEFYDSTFLGDYDWASIGLGQPARGGVRRIWAENGRLMVELDMYAEGEDGCCSSGSAVVAVEARDGTVAITEILEYDTGG